LTDQVVEDRAAGVPGQVERDGLLVAVDREEVGRLAVGEERRAHDPHRVAAVGVLDLDHFGAHVGEQHRAVRPREHAGEVEHADALEEFHAASSSGRQSGWCASLIDVPLDTGGATRYLYFPWVL